MATAVAFRPRLPLTSTITATQLALKSLAVRYEQLTTEIDALQAAADRLHPDVILIDLEMPGIGGIEATRRIVEMHPDTRIVVLTSHPSEEDVFPALKAGTFGYLLKHSTPEDVLQAIRQAYGGETVLHPAIARMVLQELHRGPQPKQTATTDPLCERELEVLRLIGRPSIGRPSSNAELGRLFLVS